LNRASIGRAWILVALAATLSLAAWQQSRVAQPDPKSVSIDLEHVLRGGINRRGELVGLHHQPSAPESLKFEGKLCELWFLYTSPGGPDDVRTARVELRDPKSQRVLVEKFSTLYPKAWSEKQIEAAIREAYADACDRRQVGSDGRWEGRTKKGVRIDGFMTGDGKAIATAFPVMVRQRDQPRR
jgi:hypothetical protein